MSERHNGHNSPAHHAFGPCATHVFAVLEHVDRDVVVVHACCVGVDAGELQAAVVVRLVIAVLVNLTRAFAAVTPIIVAFRDVVSDIAPVAEIHAQIQAVREDTAREIGLTDVWAI